jgi:hypothetical protein
MFVQEVFRVFSIGHEVIFVLSEVFRREREQVWWFFGVGGLLWAWERRWW